MHRPTRRYGRRHHRRHGRPHGCPHTPQRRTRRRHSHRHGRPHSCKYSRVGTVVGIVGIVVDMVVGIVKPSVRTNGTAAQSLRNHHTITHTNEHITTHNHTRSHRGTTTRHHHTSTRIASHNHTVARSHNPSNTELASTTWRVVRCKCSRSNAAGHECTPSSPAATARGKTHTHRTTSRTPLSHSPCFICAEPRRSGEGRVVVTCRRSSRDGKERIVPHAQSKHVHNQTTRTSETPHHSSSFSCADPRRAGEGRVVATCRRSSRDGNARNRPAHTIQTDHTTKQPAHPRTTPTPLSLLFLRRSAPLSRRSCRRDMTPIKSNWP